MSWIINNYLNKITSSPSHLEATPMLRTPKKDPENPDFHSTIVADQEWLQAKNKDNRI